MRNKELHREQNRSWFSKWRARGLCYFCKKPMSDDDPYMAHSECYKEQRRKNKIREKRGQNV